MEYEQQFERDFIRRTLELVHSYKGPLEATHLINCLLGLLIVPKESSIEKIPNDPIEKLIDWGISPDSIKKFGRCKCGNPHPKTIRQVVKSLRNSVAHFRFKPIHKRAVCIGFDFSDKSGFHAAISNQEMTTFVERLAVHLENHTSARV